MVTPSGAPSAGDLVIVKGSIGPTKLVTKTRGIWILVISGCHENWLRRTDVRIISESR
jgi:hypothetical protein